MKRTNAIAIATVIAAAIVAALAFAVPLPESWTASNALFYSVLSLTFAFVCLHIGAVVIFLLSLSAYKAELRRAYIVVSSSIALLALATLQLPVISALNLWGSAWVTHGIIGLPFVLSGVAAYLGVRSLAVLVGTRSWLTRIMIALPVIIALCALTMFLPHVTSTTPEASYDASVIILVWSALAYLAAVLILVRVLSHIGEHYRAAMAALLAGFCAACLAMTFATLGTLLSNKNQDAWSVAIDITGLFAGLLFLRAGLIFTKAKEY
ncbi:MAG TPA: hypothetical protein VLH86_02450 [Patescibacteria group bacterium]|nr:hypothetical protein [Patescibacteria group bacterium]